MDLTTERPRSSYARLHNLILLPRTIDKIRADVAGTLGEYVWRVGFSAWVLDFLGLDYDATAEAVAMNQADEAVWVWIQANMQDRAPEEVARFNRHIIERRFGPDHPQTAQKILASIGKPELADIVSICELLDLEENREASLMTDTLDLSTVAPRDPYQKFLGLVNLPRLLDKARAELAGTMGPYFWRIGQSLLLLEFLEIPAAELYEALKTDQSDEAMCEWIAGNMAPRTNVEIAYFNRGAIQNYPVTVDRMQFHHSLMEERGLGGLANIVSAFERLCWDEAGPWPG